ncbi:MAG: PKD domain-containing protein [Bacteroidales bacterium]|jgi:hypothetical protein
MKTICKILVGLMILFIGSFIDLTVSAQSWSPLGYGVDGNVSAMAEYHNELYVGGQFTKAGNINVSNIAKWDGIKWFAVASGVDASITSMCVYSGELYLGGNFIMAGSDTLNHIAKWDGKTLQPVGKGINGRILTMAVFKNELYVAGQFSNAGSIATSNIAKWDGKTWSVVGSAIAKWDNNAWNVSGSGIDGRVYSLCVFNDNLYAGGIFSFAGVTAAKTIAKWDGSNWSALGRGISVTTTVDPSARAMTIYNNELYITGFFNVAGNIAVNNIVKWDGNNFQQVGTGIEYLSTGESSGRALNSFNGELYVGGIFSNAGPGPANNIAKWNGKVWSSVDLVKSQQIICFCEFNGSLIAGGTFKGINGEPNNIASYCPYAKANFAMEPSTGKNVPLNVKFSNTSTGAKSYVWDFGDGTSAKDASVPHVFQKHGNTPITLIVTSNEGCISQKIKFITIDSLPPAKPNITENINVLSIDNPLPNEKYQWFKNDAKIFAANSPSYTVTKTGTYYLVVTNSSGSSMSEAINIVIVDNTKIAYSNLDINNINARFNSEGSMFWDFVDAKYEVPKGSGKSTIYSGTLWIGGYDSKHQLHLAAKGEDRKGNDFYSGPVMKTEKYSAVQDSLWNQVWKVTKKEIEYHKAHWKDNGYSVPTSIADWPGNGDISLGQAANLAPYVDVNQNGTYDPKNGDYPLIKGDEAVFFIFNDDRAKHAETQCKKLGIEVQAMAYAFDAPKDSALNNTIFLNYKIINRSKDTYDSVYVGLLTDTDIGNSSDDYIGCDPGLSTFFGYNGKDFDEGMYGYGKYPPAQGTTFLSEKMTHFTYYNNLGIGNPIAQDPANGNDFYNYLRSIWKDNSHATYGGIGIGGKTLCNYMFSESYGGWNEYSAGNQPGDRRGLGSIGPFTFKAGETKNIDIAYITAFDYSGNMLSVDLLKQRVVKIKAYYNANIAEK